MLQATFFNFCGPRLSKYSEIVCMRDGVYGEEGCG